MSITELAPDGAPFNIVTLKNDKGIQASFMDWGATWLSCIVPVAGQTREVLLGCQPLTGYNKQTAYLGATVGRYANRIKDSTFELDGTRYHLVANQGTHQLHGGTESFDKKRWQITAQSNTHVEFKLLSEDGDQGFPGNLTVTTIYRLTDDNQITIDFYATTDKKTVVNLTNHAYFNLDGGNTSSILAHTLQVNANEYVPVDAQGIPNQGLVAVEEGDMDLRMARTIETNLLDSPVRKLVGGYDHAYLLDTNTPIAATLTSSDKKLSMDVITTKPALQVYSGNFLAGTPNRNHDEYKNYAGIALESAFLPDTPNHPEWPQPSCYLKPDEQYHYQTIYRFINQ